MKAFDLKDARGTYQAGWERGTVIQQGSPPVPVLKQCETLLVCWPPTGDSTFCAEALALLEQQSFVYIGEDQGGLTGSPSLFRELARRWTLTYRKVLSNNFTFQHGFINVFKRRTFFSSLCVLPSWSFAAHAKRMLLHDAAALHACTSVPPLMRALLERKLEAVRKLQLPEAAELEKELERLRDDDRAGKSDAEKGEKSWN